MNNLTIAIKISVLFKIISTAKTEVNLSQGG